MRPTTEERWTLHRQNQAHFEQHRSFAGCSHLTTQAHFGKYRDMAKAGHITLKGSKLHMFDPDRLASEYDRNFHLNGIPLRLFDGFYYSGRMYQGKNWPAKSLAENVCLYKHLILYEVLGLVPEFVD